MITVSKAQEEALRRSEANLSAIIENTTDMVYSLNRDLQFITFNKLFKNTIKQVYGFDIEQGVRLLDLLDGYDAAFAEKWKGIYGKTLNGETLQFVNEYPVEGGSVYLSYSVNPIWESGEVIGLSCFSRDITQQKLHEVALVKSEANLRSVFENTDLSIVLFNTDLEIVSFNSNANAQSVKTFGKKINAGDSAFDYFPKHRWPLIKTIVKEVKNKEVVNYETMYNSKANGKDWFDAKWLGIENEQEEVVGIVLTVKNITENKIAELEREKITADLLRRNKDLEQFTYIISHNLRAPVANIKGLAEMLHYTENLDEEAVATLGALSSSINQLDKVILDLNQILQAGKQVNEKKEKILLPQLVEEISTEIHSIAAKNNVSLLHEFEGCDEVFTIRSYLHSIFQNLIINSIKYRRNIDPEIDITGRLNGNKLLICFKDNGKGIDLAKHGGELFGLYKRFDFTVEGKGMGLFMVKMQVESLGGSITVKSEINKGTEFLIELPL